MSVTVTVNGQAGPSLTATSGDTIGITLSATGTPGGVGPQGPAGATGPANSLSIGTVKSGTAAATITGTAPTQTLNLTLPQGDKGSTGSQGATGATGPAGPANTLSIGTVSGGASAAATITGTAPSQTLNLTLPAGAKGDTGSTGPAGPANALTVGSVNSGSSPSVTLTGTAPNQVLNIVLARGDTGATGATGATGPANSLSIGTVTEGGSAGASITGTAPSQVLNLTLPQGPQGAKGDTGATGAQGPAGETYTLPTATSSVLGGVKIGSGLSISSGVLSATGGGGSFSWQSPPASPTASGTAGDVAYDANYLYVRTASLWKRAAISTWNGDPYLAQTVLLLHMDGSNGATAFPDSSPSGRTVTAYGGAAVSTAQSKWGGASLYCDGSGDYLQAASSSSFDWSAGDAVVEAWIRLSDMSVTRHLCGTTSGTSDGKTGCYVESNGTIAISKIGVNAVSSSAGVISANTWYHVAFVKNGSAAYIYVNGTQVASGSASAAWSSGSAPFSIGRTFQTGGGDGDWNGYIDDLRVTLGSNRGYTGSTITTPTAAYLDF